MNDTILGSFPTENLKIYLYLLAICSIAPKVQTTDDSGIL